MERSKPILAVCGKGGVGKTAVSSLLARVLIDGAGGPVLLIDADPAGGLVSAIGERVLQTLTGAREQLIAAARNADDAEKLRLAERIDYLVLEALLERSGYAVLAMGRSMEKGCYCPANTLLRSAIDLLAEPFAKVLIDAEAGLEQINRQVTRRVTHVIGVTDGSRRSTDTLGHIAGMVGSERLLVAGNRVDSLEGLEIPPDVRTLGCVPEDPVLREFDRGGRPLWEMPPDSPALGAARGMVERLHGLWRQQP